MLGVSHEPEADYLAGLESGKKTVDATPRADEAHAAWCFCWLGSSNLGPHKKGGSATRAFRVWLPEARKRRLRKYATRATTKASAEPHFNCKMKMPDGEACTQGVPGDVVGS